MSVMRLRGGGECSCGVCRGGMVGFCSCLALLFVVVFRAPLTQRSVYPWYDVSACMLKAKTQLDQLF